MVPLLGHSAGHCGIAIKQQNQWLLFCGDAYYSHLELNPANKLRSLSLLEKTFAEDNEKRLINLKITASGSTWANDWDHLCTWPHELRRYQTWKIFAHCICGLFKPSRVYATRKYCPWAQTSRLGTLVSQTHNFIKLAMMFSGVNSPMQQWFPN